MSEETFIPGVSPEPHGLNPQMRAFCEHYMDLVREGVKSPKKLAAVRAGYAETSAQFQASRLIADPRIKTYLSELMTESAVAVNVDKSFVLFKALDYMTIAEGRGELRTAGRFLEIIAKHCDVRALLTSERGGGGRDLDSGTLSVPFDTSKLTTDDKRSLLDILDRAGFGGNPVPE